MNILKEFDKALVLEETKQNAIRNGYWIDGKEKPYNEYLDNTSFQALLNGMSSEHKKQYGAGGGKELEPRDGKPPKMASFASSSRMIYLHSKGIPNFVFEKKLTTTVGGMANLDGYLVLPDRYIYVEAKCREPYGHKAEQIIKHNYHDIYVYLREHMPSVFSCVMEDIPEKDETAPKHNMRVAFSCEGKSVANFDIKQMICHLLAVATERLKHPDDKSVLFLYFLYNPTALQLPQEEGKYILDIYADTCWAANHYDFKTMFGHIVDYLITRKELSIDTAKVEQLKKSFRFVLCDQNTYADYLK